MTLEHTVEQEAKFELIAGEAHTEAARLATLAFGNNISADEVNSKINAGIIHDLKKRLENKKISASKNSTKERRRIEYADRFISLVPNLTSDDKTKEKVWATNLKKK